MARTKGKKKSPTSPTDSAPRTWHVLIHPKDDDGWYVVDVPSLPGCTSQGNSQAEAITNIRYAIEAYIATLEEDERPIPADEPISTVVVAV